MKRALAALLLIFSAAAGASSPQPTEEMQVRAEALFALLQNRGVERNALISTLNGYFGQWFEARTVSPGSTDIVMIRTDPRTKAITYYAVVGTLKD